MLRTIKKKDFVLSVAAALLLTLSFPVSNLRFLAWVAFVPLLVALENKNKVQAFVLASVAGIVFWLGTIYWLVHVTVAGMFVLVMYLSLYWGVFGLLVAWANPLRRGLVIFFIPALWVLLEYCRSYALTGFPWALVAYTQAQAHTVIQFADITGAWGISFIILMANAAVYMILSYVRTGHRFHKAPIVVACCVLIWAYSYGAARLYSARTRSQPASHSKISVIQGNIPQKLKWDIQAREYIMQTYCSLSQQASGDNPDVIVWPEAAVPAVISAGVDYQRGLQEFSASIGTPLLTGAVTSRNENYYNSAVLFRPGVRQEQYDKIHLVPFGEYVPLRRIFSFLETVVPIGEVTRGVDYHVFRLNPADKAAESAFSCLICYEDMFPELSRRMVNKGARFLITVTNDAWYQQTSAPYQHFQASVFRAIENRVWMVRSANTGVSGFVRPDGTVEGLVSNVQGKAIFVPGYLTKEVELFPGPTTVYTKFGDWFIAAALLMAVLCVPVFRGLQGARQHR